MNVYYTNRRSHLIMYITRTGEAISYSSCKYVLCLYLPIMNCIPIQGQHPAWAGGKPKGWAKADEFPPPPPIKAPPPTAPVAAKPRPPAMPPPTLKGAGGKPPLSMASKVAATCAAARDRYNNAGSTAGSTRASDYNPGTAPNRTLPWKGPPAVPGPGHRPPGTSETCKSKAKWGPPAVPAKAPGPVAAKCNQTKPSSGKGKKHLSAPYISRAARHACICNHYIYLHVCNDISIYEQEATS